MNTLDYELEIYRPAIVCDRFLPKRLRHITLSVLSLLLITIGTVIVGSIIYDSIPTWTLDVSSVTGRLNLLSATWLLLLAPYLLLLGLTYFYNSLYFRGINTVVPEDFSETGGITHEVAALITKDRADITKGFLAYRYGKEILMRCGIPYTEVERFLRSSRAVISSDALVLALVPGRFLTLADVAKFLIQNDTPFRDFLFRHGVSDVLFNGASAWVSRVRYVHKQRVRWWSRDNLSRIRGLGQEFSYGEAFALRRYMRELNTTSVMSLVLTNAAYANEVINEVEMILTRDKAANAILVGEPGVGKMDMMVEFGKRIREGRSVASLLGKRVIVFDKDLFVVTHTTKEEFEAAFLKLMVEAEQAGHIILVLENLPLFINEAKALNVDLAELIERFLSSPNLQVVATAEPGTYHQYLETNDQLMRNFAPVLIEDPDLSSTIRVLEEATWALEHRYALAFTYAALVRVAEGANQYIVDGVMPDKALSLLSEVATAASAQRVNAVSSDFVDTIISHKTGIPIGSVGGAEREKLLHLESLLHERVVGQHDAIKAISSAMRRARVGIQSTEKPIGSFLFLGSTGVGKTETAKALAAVFFGSEEKMVRFDMSEFSDEHSLERLIGTDSRAGVLASALREHPYCVLLLDEFEKATTDVHDLFLQILDEGIFTDARGMKINARNCIIIATSNAGSTLIYDLVKAGKRPVASREAIISAIIETHAFRPELINRFDATVIFESLSERQQEKIAQMMVAELTDRVKKRGYGLTIDNAFMAALLEEGFDPEFGARPMRRAVQDIIEERIARKIIEGGLRPGDTIRLTVTDLLT